MPRHQERKSFPCHQKTSVIFYFPGFPSYRVKTAGRQQTINDFTWQKSKPNLGTTFLHWTAGIYYIVCLVGVVEHGLQLVDILELLVQEHVVDVVVLPANRCKFPIFLFHVSCAFFVFRVGHVTIF